jgi:hypothetical protein
MKEIVHQLRINLDRLGPGVTLVMIDNLQQFVHVGLLLSTNDRTTQWKSLLVKFIEHIQSNRLTSVYLQRLIEQMNASVELSIGNKKAMLTKQVSSLLTKMKTIDKQDKTRSKTNYERCLSLLIDLAYRGRLQTYTHFIDNNGLVDMLSMEQSTLTCRCELNTCCCYHVDLTG